MRARRTVKSNKVFRLAGGTEDNDLWVQEKVEDGIPIQSSVWEPSVIQRQSIADGANIELEVWGAGHPPVNIRTTRVELKGTGREGEIIRDDMVVVEGEFVVEYHEYEHNAIMLNGDEIQFDDLLEAAGMLTKEIEPAMSPDGRARSEFGKVRITIERIT